MASILINCVHGVSGSYGETRLNELIELLKPGGSLALPKTKRSHSRFPCLTCAEKARR